jgi:hypothetical protein
MALCVAVDDAGNAFTSSQPTGGASAWTHRRIDPNATGGLYELNGISCPSVSLCTAIVYYGGRVFTSRNPTGAASAWSGTRLAGTRSGASTGISCPSVTLCVIVDDGGNATVSTSPTGGVGAWHQRPIDGVNQLHAVSCPSTELCVAVDNVGNVIIGKAFPTAAAVRAFLRRLLAPMSKRARITALLQNHGYRFSVRAPSAGRLVISWHTRARSAGRAVLVASANTRFARSGAVKVRLMLTRRGSQLLRHANRLRLTEQARFTPEGSTSTTQGKRITVTR